MSKALKSIMKVFANDQHCYESIPRLDSCRTDGGTEASSGANSAPLSPEILERVEELVVGTRPGSPAQEESLPPTPALLRFDPIVCKISFHSFFLLSPATPATPATPIASIQTPATAVPASLRGRRRTSSSTGRPRDRNLSEASQHSQESSRSTRFLGC